MIVIITPEARADLDRIWSFIEQSNPRRAITFVREILARIKLLGTMPLRFQLLAGREQSEIRRMPYRNYVIFYRVIGQEIYILHILNGAQDHDAILFPDA